MRACYKDVITEYFDIHDRETRKILLSINEEEQNAILMSLTSKLYGMIVDKVTDIDYGDIPESEGDITMLESYTKIIECIKVITELLHEYKQPTDSIDTIRAALDNLENDKAIYKKGFMAKIDIIMTTYNTTALAIVNSLSYMIACCVEFIKDGHAGYKIVMDRAGIARTKDSLIYMSLVQFNNACREGQIEAAFKPLIKAKVRNFVGFTLATLATGMAIAAILMNILPIIREMVYLFFSMNTRISRYFDIQADLLEMNVQLIKNNEVDTVEDKKVVIQRQQAIAARFRKAAEFFAVKTKESDKKATQLIKKDSNDMKVNDVVDQVPDSVGTMYGNSLF